MTTGYEIWHDEHKCDETGAYAHGILAVPLDHKSKIVESLSKLRDEYGYSISHKKGYAGHAKTHKSSEFLRHTLQCASHWLAVKHQASLKLYRSHNLQKFHNNALNSTPFMELAGEPHGVKFGMMVVPANHADMFGVDYSAKVETTLRFGLKGLCHWAFNEQNPISISKIYFDGIEHHKRNMDLSRVIGPAEWRDYVSFDAKAVPVDDRHRDQRNDESAMFVDLVDSIVGSLYNCSYKNPTSSSTSTEPLVPIIERLRNNLISTNANGRWHKSITSSEVLVTSSGNFDFRPLSYSRNEKQLALCL